MRLRWQQAVGVLLLSVAAGYLLGLLRNRRAASASGYAAPDASPDRRAQV